MAKKKSENNKIRVFDFIKKYHEQEFTNESYGQFITEFVIDVFDKVKKTETTALVEVGDMTFSKIVENQCGVLIDTTIKAQKLENKYLTRYELENYVMSLYLTCKQLYFETFLNFDFRLKSSNNNKEVEEFLKFATMYENDMILEISKYDIKVLDRFVYDYFSYIVNTDDILKNTSVFKRSFEAYEKLFNKYIDELLNVHNKQVEFRNQLEVLESAKKINNFFDITEPVFDKVTFLLNEFKDLDVEKVVNLLNEETISDFIKFLENKNS